MLRKIFASYLGVTMVLAMYMRLTLHLVLYVEFNTVSIHVA